MMVVSHYRNGVIADPYMGISDNHNHSSNLGVRTGENVVAIKRNQGGMV